MPAGIETVIAAEAVRPRRGKILEEVLIKRETGHVRRVVLDRVGAQEEGDGDQEIKEIKEEPID